MGRGSVMCAYMNTEVRTVGPYMKTEVRPIEHLRVTEVRHLNDDRWPFRIRENLPF